MLEVQEQLDQFVLEIKNTQVYQEYQKQKNKIKEYPELKQQIDEFRQKNFELQSRTFPENLYDEVDKFQKEYEQFRDIPMVYDFLSAELAFCRMIQEVTTDIIESVSQDFE